MRSACKALERAVLLHIREEISLRTERSREVSRRSVEILKGCVPDTFLGRPTHEPLPSEQPAPVPDLRKR